MIEYFFDCRPSEMKSISRLVDVLQIEPGVEVKMLRHQAALSNLDLQPKANGEKKIEIFLVPEFGLQVDGSLVLCSWGEGVVFEGKKTFCYYSHLVILSSFSRVSFCLSWYVLYKN